MLDMSSTYSEPARARAAWVAGFALGVADGYLYFLLPVVAVLLIGLLGLLMSWRGPRLALFGGSLAGFGLTWVVLLAVGVAGCGGGLDLPGNGCRSGNAGYFVATGAILLLFGAIATWRAARPGRRRPASGGRALGAAVGFLGALGIVTLIALLDAARGRDPYVPYVGWPIVIAGTLGGWLVGPRAAVARSRLDWLRATLVLACWALVIGAAVTVIELVSGPAGIARYEPSSDVIAQAPLLVLTWIFGIVVAGPATLPFTFVAAAVWAALMARLRPGKA